VRGWFVLPCLGRGFFKLLWGGGGLGVGEGGFWGWLAFFWGGVLLCVSGGGPGGLGWVGGGFFLWGGGVFFVGPISFCGPTLFTGHSYFLAAAHSIPVCFRFFAVSLDSVWTRVACFGQSTLSRSVPSPLSLPVVPPCLSLAPAFSVFFAEVAELRLMIWFLFFFFFSIL